VTGRSLFQRNPTEWGVSECDREASWWRPRLSRHEMTIFNLVSHFRQLTHVFTLRYVTLLTHETKFSVFIVPSKTEDERHKGCKLN
jgi:hypothetical protein